MSDAKSINRIKELVVELNNHRDSYYNDSISKISDYEYDKMFDELENLEGKTGFIMSNSPTQNVGYDVKSKLEKIKHSHPMLSLDKTKSTNDLIKFAGEQDCILSLKLDGLTVLLTYENGNLVQAETRGNGEEGEIITHNAVVFENIPLHIDYKGKLEIEGEAIITNEDFEKINNNIVNQDGKYKNSRNLVSGSVRQLDNRIAAKRHIRFVAWKVPTEINGLTYNNSFFSRLKYVCYLGFDIVPLFTFSSNEDKECIDCLISYLKKSAYDFGYPIDGLVMTYDNILYGESLGKTGHHPKHSIAYKFYDEEVETIIRDIEWDVSKSGLINPVAVFDEVDLDGALTTRATLHNISYIEDLQLGIGDAILVYRANSVIPKVGDNITRSNTFVIPDKCPCCGGEAIVNKDNDSKVLVCTNDNCKGKLLGKLTHFVSKNAMNIDGLSESTLEKLMDIGWIKGFIDIYSLNNWYNDMVNLDGFGEKSSDKLMVAIENSKNTTLDKFVYSLSIPLIGRSASKDVSKHFKGSFDRFFEAHSNGYVRYEDYIDGFGEKMSTSINEYMLKDSIGENIVYRLAQYMNFATASNDCASSDLAGLTFVITGSMNKFENRDALKETIENAGGKVSGSISKKTSYLINNDVESTSGKNKKAKELNVPIITEEEFLEMLK